MKPSWLKKSNSIGLENFYALTGCSNSLVIRYLIARFLLEFFDINCMRKLGFSFASIGGGNSIETVFDGKIVYLEFYLKPSENYPSWSLIIGSLSKKAADGVFKKVLSYVAEEALAFEDISEQRVLLLTEELEEEIDKLRNLHKYLGYASLAEYNEAQKKD